MTPLERAEKVITEWEPTRNHLVDLIQTVIVEATNAEVERRRAAEEERDRLQRVVNKLSGQPSETPVPEKKIEFGDNFLRLKIRHPATNEWWEFSAIKESEVGHG